MRSATTARPSKLRSPRTPDFLAALKLHYLRWLLFDVGDGLIFQYQGIFDTDFDKYTEDAVRLVRPERNQYGVHQS